MTGLDQLHRAEVGDPEIETRIAPTRCVPDAEQRAGADGYLRRARAIHALYGIEPGKASFANNCLLARRLIERGVRFVQLYHRGWDTHGASVGTDIAIASPRCASKRIAPQQRSWPI